VFRLVFGVISVCRLLGVVGGIEATTGQSLKGKRHKMDCNKFKLNTNARMLLLPIAKGDFLVIRDDYDLRANLLAEESGFALALGRFYTFLIKMRTSYTSYPE
jgi:hypothetical protein